VPTVCIDIDSLRADHVSAYGYHGETTPNIDRLAEERPAVVEELEDAMLRWVERHRMDDPDPLRQVGREGPAGYLAFRDQFDGV